MMPRIGERFLGREHSASESLKRSGPFDVKLDLDNNIGSDENPFIWNIGARVHFLKFLSVGALYEMQEDDEQILGNVRFSF